MTVIVLKEVPATCPLRNELRKMGRIKEIGFSKVDSEEEVNSEITYAFKGIELKSFQFLHAQKDNSLSVAANQQLDGLGATKLAGYGSLCIQELPETLSSPLNVFQSVSNEPYCLFSGHVSVCPKLRCCSTVSGSPCDVLANINE